MKIEEVTVKLPDKEKLILYNSQESKVAAYNRIYDCNFTRILYNEDHELFLEDPSDTRYGTNIESYINVKDTTLRYSILNYYTTTIIDFKYEDLRKYRQSLFIKIEDSFSKKPINIYEFMLLLNMTYTPIKFEHSHQKQFSIENAFITLHEDLDNLLMITLY